MDRSLVSVSTEARFESKPTSSAGRSGKVRLIALVATIAVAAVGMGAAVAIQAVQPAQLVASGFVFEASPPIRTGHQRAERLVFADGGRVLAVTCPRYNFAVLYGIEAGQTPAVLADIRLEGKPVALAAARDRIYVLERPSGDARHVEPGWLEAFDFEGRPIGSRLRVGWDPDDLALNSDGRTLLVVLSGHAEGESNRPAPRAITIDLENPIQPRICGQVDFDRPGDDPERVAIAVTEQTGVENPPLRAAVSLHGSDEIAWIEVDAARTPRIVSRTRLPGGGVPGSITFDGRDLIACDTTTGSVKRLRFGAVEDRVTTPIDSTQVAVSDLVRLHMQVVGSAATGPWTFGLTSGSSSVVVQGPDGTFLGSLPLTGSLGLGKVIPMGLAAASTVERAWIAVADRSGGVHLIAMRPADRDALR